MYKFFFHLLLKKYNPQMVAVWGNYGRTAARMMIASVLQRDYDVISGRAEHFERVFWKHCGGWRGVFVPKKHTKKLIAVLECEPQEDAYHALKKELSVRAIVVTPSTDIPGFTDLFSGEESSAYRFRKELTRIHSSKSSTPPTLLRRLFSEAVLRLNLSFIKNFLQTSNGVRQGPLLVLNYDDEAVRSLAGASRLRRVTYGMNADAQLYAGEVKPHVGFDEKHDMLEAGIYAKVHAGGSIIPFHVPYAFGRQHIYAALAALAIADCFDMNIVEAVEGMQRYEAPEGNGNICVGMKETIIVDASTGATPFFVRELLDVARQAVQEEGEERRIVVVLGDIFGFGEGNDAAQLHKTLGEYIGKAAQEVYLVGERIVFTEEVAAQEIAAECIRRYDNVDTAAKELERNLKKGNMIVIFGTPGINMKNVVEQIREKK